MQKKHLTLVGRGLILLVAAVLVLAGVLKIVNVGAEDMLEGLERANLIQHQTLISVLAIVCGVLLAVPRTRMPGVLMSTAYWGGAIVAHLTYNDSAAMPASFLVVLWLGTALESGCCGFSRSEAPK